MLSIILLGVFIFLFISNRSLALRVNALESKLKNRVLPEAGLGEANPANLAKSGVVSKNSSEYGLENQAKLESGTDNMAGMDQSKLSSYVEGSNRFTTWLKEDWLMKLGALLFIVGFGWFVSYAFANNWIGPIGRITIGVVAGIIIMALGFWRMMKYKAQGAVFMALGAGMAILTIFAGQVLYDFFTPVSAVALDCVIAVFVSYASYKFNVKSLAFIAQILAFTCPLLTAGITDAFFLFSYLFFISFATLFFASFTGWRELIVSSLMFVGLYSIPYVSYSSYGSDVDAPIILNFIYLFGIMYLLAGMFAVVRKGVENVKTEILLATLNGFLLFVWIFNVAPKEWQSMLFALWAVVFIASAFVAFRASSQLAPFYGYGAVAVAFIAAATATELSGSTLTIAFTVEALLLVLAVLYLTRNIRVANTVSWLFIAPIFLSLSSVADYGNTSDLFSADFFVLVFIALALIVAGRVLVSFQDENSKEKDTKSGALLVVLGIFYFGYIIWQFIHIFMVETPDMATMTTLVIYTFFGIIAYFSGLYGRDSARKTYGIALLAFVVVRLVLFDVWQMELFGRVVTFLAIGILLMSTAFLTKRQKKEIDSSRVINK